MKLDLVRVNNENSARCPENYDSLHMRSFANRIGAIYRFCRGNVRLTLPGSKTGTRTIKNKVFPIDLCVSHTVDILMIELD